MGKTAAQQSCKLGRFLEYKLCIASNTFNGDNIGRSAVNLFRRSLNRDPLSPDVDNLLPFWFVPYEGLSKGGVDGELDLAAGTQIRIGAANNNHDDVGDDLNHIVLLLMAKLRYPSLISDIAMHEYIKQRAHSYGSYLGAYYAKYGDDMNNYQQRILTGIGTGWKPDVSPPVGALRWYFRPVTGGPGDESYSNPQLATSSRS